MHCHRDIFRQAQWYLSFSFHCYHITYGQSFACLWATLTVLFLTTEKQPLLLSSTGASQQHAPAFCTSSCKKVKSGCYFKAAREKFCTLKKNAICCRYSYSYLDDLWGRLCSPK